MPSVLTRLRVRSGKLEFLAIKEPGFHANRTLLSFACAIAIQRAPLTGARDASQHQRRCKQKTQSLYHRIVHQDAVGPRLYSAAVKIKASNSPLSSASAGQPHFSTEHRAASSAKSGMVLVEPRPSCSSFHHARCDVHGVCVTVIRPINHFLWR